MAAKNAFFYVAKGNRDELDTGSRKGVKRKAEETPNGSVTLPKDKKQSNKRKKLMPGTQSLVQEPVSSFSKPKAYATADVVVGQELKEEKEPSLSDVMTKLTKIEDKLDVLLERHHSTKGFATSTPITKPTEHHQTAKDETPGELSNKVEISKQLFPVGASSELLRQPINNSTAITSLTNHKCNEAKPTFV